MQNYGLNIGYCYYPLTLTFMYNGVDKKAITVAIQIFIYSIFYKASNYNYK